MSIETKQKFSQFYDKYTWLIWLFIGIIIGIIIDGKIHYKINLIGKQIGSLAEWIGGLATTASVITSLRFATRKRPDVKVFHSLKQDIDKISKKTIPSTLSITFSAFNQSTNIVVLQFYGLRKNKLDNFVRPTSYEKKEIKPGNSLEYEFRVSDINRDYHLENYKGKIEIGFAKPDGTLYTETIKWNDFKLNTKGIENLLL